MLRKPDTLDELPEEVKQDFFDTQDVNVQKLKTLKEMIKEKFPVCYVYIIQSWKGNFFCSN